jgi:hypothetical protein
MSFIIVTLIGLLMISTVGCPSVTALCIASNLDARPAFLRQDPARDFFLFPFQFLVPTQPCAHPNQPFL